MGRGTSEDRRNNNLIEKIANGYLAADAPVLAQDLAKVKRIETESEIKLRKAKAEDVQIRLEAREAAKPAREMGAKVDEMFSGYDSALYTTSEMASMIGLAAPEGADTAATIRKFFGKMIDPIMAGLEVEWVMEPTDEDPLAPVQMPEK